MITYEQLIKFFELSGRKTECSACGQSAMPWLFHVASPDASEPDEAELHMTVFQMPASAYGKTMKGPPMIAIECSRCARVELINALSVRRYLSGTESD